MRVALIDFDVRALDRNVVTHLPPGIKVHELGPVVPNEAAIRRALADQNESAPIVFHFNTRTDVNSPRPIAPDGPADALDRVLSILRRDLDVIVVDGPPLFVSDACMLAERCKQGRTTAAEMEEALSTLEKHRRKNTDIMTLLTHANDTDAFGVSARYRYSYERSRKAS
jgi:hypothetical protein